MVHEGSVYFNHYGAPECAADFELRGAVAFLELEKVLDLVLLSAGELVVSIEAAHVELHTALVRQRSLEDVFLIRWSFLMACIWGVSLF